MGNPRKPTALKLLEGTVQPCRAVEEAEWPMVDGYPAPPDWLTGPDAESQWHKSVRWLSNARVLTDPDLDRLATLCNIHAGIVGSWRSGTPPTARDLTEYRIWCGDFGFTPATRHKAVAMGKSKTDNPFAGFDS